MPSHHATTTHPLHGGRLALASPPSTDVWWPADRCLARQLPVLAALWPPARGRVVRVLYDAPDWDDHPRRITVDAGHSIRTDPFQVHHVVRPHAPTPRRLDVFTAQGHRHHVTLVAPHTDVRTARALLAAVGADPGSAGPDAAERPRDLGVLLAQVAAERRAVTLMRSRVRSRETDGDLADARDRLVSALQQVCDELARTGRPVSPRLLSELRLYRGLGSR